MIKFASLKEDLRNGLNLNVVHFINYIWILETRSHTIQKYKDGEA